MQGAFYAPNPGPAWFLFWLALFHSAVVVAARDPQVGAMKPVAVVATSLPAETSSGRQEDALTTDAPVPLDPTLQNSTVIVDFRHAHPSSERDDRGGLLAEHAPGVITPASARPSIWMLCIAGLGLGVLQGVEMVFLPAGLVMPISWGSLPFDVAFFIAGLAGAFELGYDCAKAYKNRNYTRYLRAQLHVAAFLKVSPRRTRRC